MTARRILDRLRGGWRPTDNDLADAAVIRQWRLLSTRPGPYVLQGRVGGRRVSTIVIALDSASGWARAPGHWLILGPRSADLQRVVSEAEIMSKAADWADRQLDDADE